MKAPITRQERARRDRQTQSMKSLGWCKNLGNAADLRKSAQSATLITNGGHNDRTSN
jgi:hypothetical protein